MATLVNLVWLKRDLRLRDHAPIKAAAAEGLPVLLCFCFDPELMADVHYSARHNEFIQQSIDDLNSQLLPYSTSVLCVQGAFSDAIALVSQHYIINAVFSHQEVGLASSYQRDKQIQKLLNKRNINWVELPFNGVIRGLSHRQNWQTLLEPNHAGAVRRYRAIKGKLVTLAAFASRKYGIHVFSAC